MVVVKDKVKSGAKKKSSVKVIKNRFGEFQINLEKKLFFYSGLLGMPGYRNFCLTELPKNQSKTFMLLQSVEDEETAFITLPLLKDEQGNYPLIENQDIEVAAKELGVKEKDLVVLLISNIANNDNNKPDIYVNVRAPLIIDASKKAGLQYVFPNDKYDVRLKINE